MSTTPDRLYNLLPPYYRERDAARGYPLQQLLQVITTQVNLVEADMTRLYANWFIETCEDWVVPYIGDLIGHKAVQSASSGADIANILVQRQDVANTLGYRRRKGTLGLLEEMALTVAGWPARVLECGRQVASTQHLDHLHLHHGRTLDMHNPGPLSLLGSPFDQQGRTLGLGGLNTPRSAGRYNLPSVALFVWRLKIYPVTRGRACSVEKEGNYCYTFSILGNDTPLYNYPEARVAPEQIAGERDLPVPIRREQFAVKDRGTSYQASPQYYGEGRSLAIWAGRWAGCDPAQPVPAEKIIPVDLSKWRYRPRHGYLAVDPETGRIAFPPTQLPEHEVLVSYYYAFSADVGGGAYPRRNRMYPGSRLYCVGADAEFPHFHAAHAQWVRDKPASAVIQFNDSGVHGGLFHIELAEQQHLELRAASGTRPVIALRDGPSGRPDALTVNGNRKSSFILEGILVTGRGLEVRGALEQVVLRDVTLVPGWELNADCTPRRAEEASLQLVETSAAIRIESSILGTIAVVGGKERKTGWNRVEIVNSIVDATSETGAAIHALGEAVAPVLLTVKGSTLLGRVESHMIELAENSIFAQSVLVARRQAGCMRFCYVAPGSRTPPRYSCQPDLVLDRVNKALDGQVRTQDARAWRDEERGRVEPQFASTRYGDPNYCRLADACAAELKTGADDQSEMGVFHDLFEARREASLQARLEEYTPAGMEAAILFET